MNRTVENCFKKRSWQVFRGKPYDPENDTNL